MDLNPGFTKAILYFVKSKMGDLADSGLLFDIALIEDQSVRNVTGTVIDKFLTDPPHKLNSE